MAYGRNHSGCAVGRGGDHSAACGVLFVDGHGVDGDPVDGRERVFGADSVEALSEATGAAANVESAWKDAFGGDTAFGALLHRLPEGEDALPDLVLKRKIRKREIRKWEIRAGGGSEAGAPYGCGGLVPKLRRVERAFVGEDEFRDGHLMSTGGGEELGGVAEGVRDFTGAGCAFGVALGYELRVGDDEAAADGVEDLFQQLCACAVEGGEAHSVGVRVNGGVGIHLVAAEVEVLGFGERDCLFAVEGERASGADGGNFSFDGGGVYGVWSFAEEAEEDGAVGSMADAGEGERSVEVDVDPCGWFEEIFFREFAGEAEGGAHGADGVGA